ncbi:hypothetical protein OEZ49_18785, partial [Ruegeria sp. WL0004]
GSVFTWVKSRWKIMGLPGHFSAKINNTQDQIDTLTDINRRKVLCPYCKLVDANMAGRVNCVFNLSSSSHRPHRYGQ